MNAYIIAGFRSAGEVCGRWSVVYGREGEVCWLMNAVPTTIDQ